MSRHLTDVYGQKTIKSDLYLDTKMKLFCTLVPLRAGENIAGALRFLRLMRTNLMSRVE